MNLKKHINKDKLKWAITFVSLILLVATVISLFVGLNNMQTTRKLSIGDYHLGSISSVDGSVVESKKYIYSDKNNVEDLKIEIKEDATVTYKVAFYDADDEFIAIVDCVSDNLNNEEIPETAKTFRIEIKPAQVDGEDIILNSLSVIKYHKMLDVEFAK